MRNIFHWIITGITFAGVLVVLIMNGFSHRERIAYVETSRLVENYQGMIRARKDYQQKVALWSANLDTLKNELSELRATFNKEKQTMTNKEIALQEELIATKQKQLSQYQEAIAHKAETEDTRMTQEVVNEMNAFIKAYGDQNGYDVIIGATQLGNLAYAREALNITDDLLEELNGTK